MSLRPTWLGGAGIHLGDHPFGLDNEIGRDMFAMTMKGVQTTLVVIFVVGLMTVVIGVTVGAVAGYFGGRIDSILMRFTDVIIVIPLLVTVSVFAFVFEATGMWTLALVMGFFLWTGLARLVRAEFLALREREFVDAARVAGASSRRIIFKHILPNSVGVIVVGVTLLMGAAILTEAALGLPRVRHPTARRVARQPRRGLRLGVLQPALAVRVARRLHHRDRAVPAVHRRRPARRLRPTAEADPEAQGPRAGDHPRRGRTDEPVADPTRAGRARGDVKHYAMSPTTPSATSTAPPASVPRCHRTGTRSCSSTGLSR